MVTFSIGFLSFFLLLLLSSFSFALDLNPRSDYKKAQFPCHTKCAELSTGTCFATAWEIPAEKSKKLTEDCSIVVFSMSLGRDVAGLPYIYDFWAGNPCNIMYLSRNSALANDFHIKDFQKVNNWTVILVDDFPEFTTLRRAGKIPKLSPSSFLSPNVTYGIYLDSKYILRTHPAKLINMYTLSHTNVIITAVAHPVNTNVEEEIKLIDKVRRGVRPTVTENFQTIMAQYHAYEGTGLFQKLLAHNVSQPFLEAGMLIHTLHDSRADEFLCSWLQQVQQFSDRDQIAFPFVAGWYNDFLPHLKFPDYRLIPLKFPDSIAFINVLSVDHYWNREKRFGDQSYQAWHHTVSLNHRHK